LCLEYLQNKTPKFTKSKRRRHLLVFLGFDVAFERPHVQKNELTKWDDSAVNSIVGSSFLGILICVVG